MGARTHQFSAVAFEENLALRSLAGLFPNARISALELYIPVEAGGVYIFPFGAVVTHDVSAQGREAVIARLRELLPKLTAQVVREEYTVAEDPDFTIGIVDGSLRLDRLTPGRAAVV